MRLIQLLANNGFDDSILVGGITDDNVGRIKWGEVMGGWERERERERLFKLKFNREENNGGELWLMAIQLYAFIREKWGTIGCMWQEKGCEKEDRNEWIKEISFKDKIK